MNTKTLWSLMAAGVLLTLATGCRFNDHYNYGATEKWVDSDLHTIVKVVGTPVVAIVDGVISPATMSVDQTADATYHPDHEYMTYSGSRVIARSDMGLGYQWLSSIFSIPLETFWLLVTLPVDAIHTLSDSRTHSPQDDPYRLN